MLKIQFTKGIVCITFLISACQPPNTETVSNVSAFTAPIPVVKSDSYDPNNIIGDFVYGAVYFRRTNPPPEDWSRDYQTAQEDGHNIFRHWFLWGAIEKSPGVYDWSEYDPHMDLAAKHGIKVIIAEMLTSPRSGLLKSLTTHGLSIVTAQKMLVL